MQVFFMVASSGGVPGGVCDPGGSGRARQPLPACTDEIRRRLLQASYAGES